VKRKLLTETDREMVIAQIKRLDLGKTYTVEITEKKSRRTISQNSLYWLWLTCIEHETGTDRDDLHEYFKRKYLTPDRVQIFGQYYDRFSTKDLNTTQFKYLLDHIQVFAQAELAITLPDPDDQRFDDFYKYYVDKL
jgi:hypothetical protein